MALCWLNCIKAGLTNEENLQDKIKITKETQKRDVKDAVEKRNDFVEKQKMIAQLQKDISQTQKKLKQANKDVKKAKRDQETAQKALRKAMVKYFLRAPKDEYELGKAHTKALPETEPSTRHAYEVVQGQTVGPTPSKVSPPPAYNSSPVKQADPLNAWAILPEIPHEPTVVVEKGLYHQRVETVSLELSANMATFPAFGVPGKDVVSEGRVRGGCFLTTPWENHTEMRILPSQPAMTIPGPTSMKEIVDIMKAPGRRPLVKWMEDCMKSIEHGKGDTVADRILANAMQKKLKNAGREEDARQINLMFDETSPNWKRIMQSLAICNPQEIVNERVIQDFANNYSWKTKPLFAIHGALQEMDIQLDDKVSSNPYGFRLFRTLRARLPEALRLMVMQGREHSTWWEVAKDLQQCWNSETLDKQAVGTTEGKGKNIRGLASDPPRHNPPRWAYGGSKPWQKTQSGEGRQTIPPQHQLQRIKHQQRPVGEDKTSKSLEEARQIAEQKETTEEIKKHHHDESCKKFKYADIKGGEHKEKLSPDIKATPGKSQNMYGSINKIKQEESTAESTIHEKLKADVEGENRSYQKTLNDKIKMITDAITSIRGIDADEQLHLKNLFAECARVHSIYCDVVDIVDPSKELWNRFLNAVCDLYDNLLAWKELRYWPNTAEDRSDTTEISSHKQGCAICPPTDDIKIGFIDERDEKKLYKLHEVPDDVKKKKTYFCQVPNVIYLITCTGDSGRCEKRYVGKTTKHLKKRYGSKGTTHRHFTNTNHREKFHTLQIVNEKKLFPDNKSFVDYVQINPINIRGVEKLWIDQLIDRNTDLNRQTEDFKRSDDDRHHMSELLRNFISDHDVKHVMPETVLTDEDLKHPLRHSINIDWKQQMSSSSARNIGNEKMI